MKIKKLGLSGLVAVIMVFGFTLYSQADVSAVRVNSGNEALILNPGMASSCQNDFVIENLDNEAAELKVILGNEEFMEDRIEGKSAKA